MAGTTPEDVVIRSAPDAPLQAAIAALGDGESGGRQTLAGRIKELSALIETRSAGVLFSHSQRPIYDDIRR